VSGINERIVLVLIICTCGFCVSFFLSAQSVVIGENSNATSTEDQESGGGGSKNAAGSDDLFNFNPVVVANAGKDKVAFVGDVVVLDGSAAFENHNQHLNYNWYQVSPPTPHIKLSKSHDAHPFFQVPKIDREVKIKLLLVVSDGKFHDDDFVVITLKDNKSKTQSPKFNSNIESKSVPINNSTVDESLNSVSNAQKSKEELLSNKILAAENGSRTGLLDESKRRLSLTCEPAQIQLHQENTSSTVCKLENKSNKKLNLSLECMGLVEVGISCLFNGKSESDKVTLPSESSSNINVEMRALESAQPGKTYSFTIRATCKNSIDCQ